MNQKQNISNSEIQIEVNDNLFFLKQYLHFLLNLINNHRDIIQDDNLFNALDEIMPSSDVEKIIKSCTTKRLRKEFEEKRSRSKRVDFDSDATNEIIQGLWNSRETRLKLRRCLRQFIESYISQIDLLMTEKPNYSNMYEKHLTMLQNNFQLSDLEIKFIIMKMMIRDNYLDADDFRNYRALGLVQRFASLLDSSTSEVLQVTSPDGKLRRFGFIDSDMDLKRELLSFLNGMDDKPLSTKYYSQLKEKTLPWKYFSRTAEIHGEIIKKLIKSINTGRRRGLNILLYGEPGTGKTSFAAALAKECGVNAYTVAQNKIEERSDSSAGFRFAALHICDHQVDSKKSLVIIDEADDMLRGRSLGPFASIMRNVGDKGHLNTVLDKINSPCIWIANINKKELDASTARRFDYAVKFEPLTVAQRSEIWKNSIKKYNITVIPKTMVVKFAEKYKLSAGIIDTVMNNLATILSSQDGGKCVIEETLEKLIKPHCELLDIKVDNKKFPIASDYSLKGINVKGDISTSQIVESVLNFRKELQMIKENGAGGIDSPRMNILLYGPPGTGKTEFVKYLAAKIKCDIHIKMGSDILGKYVGESEENIKYAFREAEESGSILFLDEVDGLLRSRGAAHNSWEVTQVNELLYQMENFKGVLVCATNFRKNLDPATIRRFLIKVNFDYLDDEGKLIFYKKMLANLAGGRLSRNEIDQLKSIQNLTPGDFRNIRQTSYYLNRATLTHQDILNRLRNEAAEKTGTVRHKIGFSMTA
jgi:SpoVK/Ycf46/Vps4 family AAA+-type ATPase